MSQSIVEDDDFEALSRDQVFVRSLREDDIEPIVAIDRHITGRDRRPYLARKVDEVLRETGIRVSLIAELDGQVAGYVMARVDYGEFGQTGTSAVMDTVGVDPAFAGRRVGRALLSQLLGNLAALRVEIVRTEVGWESFDLNRFLAGRGFKPAQQLALSRRVAPSGAGDG